jgi:hypothetical protein
VAEDFWPFLSKIRIIKMTESEYNPYELARCLDDEAKWYWSAALLLGIGVFLVGLLGIFQPDLSTVAAYLAAVLTLVAFFFNHLFESSRGKAQELRRKLDLQDAFGWGIPRDEFNDLLVNCSKGVKKRAKGKEPDSPYFESKEPAGPKRALQNVRESAWWSEHLSRKMCVLCSWSTCFVLGVAVVSLIAALATVESVRIKDLSIYSKIARAITSVLMLLFSLSLVKLTISYYNFSKGAAKCKDAVSTQLQKSPKNGDAAIVKMYEYFVVRSGSPVLPTWLWKWNRDELNNLYPYKDEAHSSS